MAFAGYLFCLYSTLPWLYGRPYDPFWSAIIFPLNSTVWALVVTLVIWLCITKNGSIVGRFLSWSGFRPLSRMTYSVYLCHAWVCWVALGTRRDLIDLSPRALIITITGIVLVSYVIGFLFTIMFETPIIHSIEHIKNKWIENSLKNKEKMAGIRKMGKVNNNGEQWGKELKLLEVVTTATN